MRLSKSLSNKCQLILIPGETRAVEAEVEDFQRLELFISSDGKKRICLGRGTNPLRITVPRDIAPATQWAGELRVDGESFCRFEARILSEHLAFIAGFYQ